MKLSTLVFGYATLTLISACCVGATNSELDEEALEQVLQSLAEKADLNDTGDADELASVDGDKENSLRDLFAAYRATDQKDVSKDEDVELLLNKLSKLDDSKIQDHIDDKDSLDLDNSGRSHEDDLATDSLQRRLMADLRRLGFVNKGRLYESLLRKIRIFFQRIETGIYTLRRQSKNNVLRWFLRLRKAEACRFCSRSTRPVTMYDVAYRWLRSSMSTAACGICRRGWEYYLLH